MEDFPVASRLKSLISSLGLSDSQFADKCNISRSTLSLLLSGKNKKISDVMLSQIHEAFPQVSIMWLLFGEGEKFNNEESQSDVSIIKSEENENSLFSASGKDFDEHLNLISVKQIENVLQQVVNKIFTPSFKNMEDLIIKNSETTSQRKVSKITVYYGDSTFETFVPE